MRCFRTRIVAFVGTAVRGMRGRCRPVRRECFLLTGAQENCLVLDSGPVTLPGTSV